MSLIYLNLANSQFWTKYCDPNWTKHDIWLTKMVDHHQPFIVRVNRKDELTQKRFVLENSNGIFHENSKEIKLMNEIVEKKALISN